MAQTIKIDIGGIPAGQIIFNDAPAQLITSRTATGFNLSIPATVELEYTDSSKPCPMLSNLCGTISVDMESGAEMELGIIKDDRWYTGGKSESEKLVLVWSGLISALTTFEKIRGGKSPKLKIKLHGEACWLLPYNDGNKRVRTEPYSIDRDVQITYPTEVWIKMLRGLQVAENILVEIPLPSAPPTPWDEIWKALVEARNTFEQGGSTGWKECVAAVRLSLEKWQDIEKEDMGPGWKSPTKEEREGRSKKQRLNNLRWHLLQLAHLAVHSSADEWSRDDALLMLSTLSALLAERKP